MKGSFYSETCVQNSTGIVHFMDELADFSKDTLKENLFFPLLKRVDSKLFKFKNLPFLLFLFFSSQVSMAQTSEFNFNTTGQLSNNFNGSGTHVSNVVQASDGGLNNSGSVSVPNSSTNAVFTTKNSYSLGVVGSSYTFETFIKSEGNSGYSGVGFTASSPTTSFHTSPVYRPNDALGISVHGGGFEFHNGTVNYSGSWGVTYSSGSITTIKASTCSDLINNNTSCGSPDKWFKIVFKVTRSTISNFDMRVEVWPANQDGTLRFPSEATAIFEVNGVTNSTLSSASQLYSYFNFSGHRVTKFDNFSYDLKGATEIQAGAPVILTESVSESNGVITVNGNVTSDNGETVTERGFVYGTSTNPTTTDNKIIIGSGTGAFSGSTPALMPGTYFVRAFATNSVGTSYGGVESFTIEAPASLYAGGSGTELDPYQISDWRHLHNVRQNLSSYFILLNDLDQNSTGYATYASSAANENLGWLPIGTYGNTTNAFSGNFDGRVKTIRGLKIKRLNLSGVGLFGIANGATISNVGLEEVMVEGKATVGSLVGFMATEGIIDNCYAKGYVKSEEDTSGGLAGSVYGTVVNCFASVNVIGTYQIGGLIGAVNVNATVNNSYATGAVEGSDESWTGIGGLAGFNGGAISNSYATGSVTGAGSSVGGLVGYNGGSVNKSYAIGQVTGAVNPGGLIGENDGGTVVNSFWDTETSDRATSSGGEGKTTAEMKTQGNFTDWNFQDIWNINPAGYSSYPYLRTLTYDSPGEEPEVNPIPGLEIFIPAPTVTDANIIISGATGTGGVFKIGNTITATWNNTLAGDNNTEIISSVTMDFSQFGGGSAVVATNNSGIWTATYTLTAGEINAANRNVSVTATNSSSKTTTTADTSNATVDNVAPIVSEFVPGNNATGVALQPTLIITFDDEVTLGNIGIFSLGKVDGDGCTITSILEFDLSDPDERSLFTLSEDKLTVSLVLTENLPVNTQVILAIPTGFVTDLVGNSFVGFSAYTYTWSFTTINKLNQTITFPEIETKTYGDPTFTLGNAETDQGLTVTYTATDPTVVSIIGNQATILKAGSTTITATQDGDEVNFAAEPVERTLTVGKKALTITADDKQKTYGEANPVLTFTYTGLVNGDTKVTTEPSISTTALASSNAGTYPITLEGGSDDNYAITLVNGTLTIDKKALTITADDKQKTYGEANPALTFSYTGLVNGDTKVTTEPSISTTATQSSNV
ncbi:The GLUG motif-containing protein, partial [Algoriphagus alkaliphilus]